MIAMLAPPWIPVPPPGYGGIESVVALLTDALVRRGHDVTLFAAAGSRSAATVRPLLEHPPEEMDRPLNEADHVARAFAEIDASLATDRPCTVVHDHCGFTAFAMADRIGAPIVHTLHGPFTRERAAFYRAHGHRAHAVAISRAQRAQAPPALRVAGVVPNPIDVDDWPFEERKGDYLLWVGRMAEEKGPHRAIAAARAAGLPLVMAGPIQPGQEELFASSVEPHLDGDKVRYLGELGGEEKKRLFARARALLMPIRWPEPFGMVMIEAMASGTPVIAFPEGAAPEVVAHGRSGFLVEDEQAMARAVARLDEIDPAECRALVTDRYDVDRVASAYERVYWRVRAARPSSAAPRSNEARAALSVAPG